MPKLGNILRGRKAKRSGDGFETLLKSCALRSKFEVIHLPPSGAKTISNTKFIRVRIPFDFIFSKDSKAIFIDAKHKANGSTFPRSNINIQQVLPLIGLESTGHVAGYIVQFTKDDLVVFFSAKKLWDLKYGDSLSPNAGTFIGNSKYIDLDLLLKFDIK